MRPAFGAVLLLIVTLVSACGGGSTPEADRTETPVAIPDPTVEPDLTTLGQITFGTKYDSDSLLISEPRTRFKATYPEIAWSAQFSEAAGATTITLILASVTSGGAESVVMTTETNIANPQFSLIANAADLASIVDNKPGRYVMRYLRESTLLAEGEFELVK